MACRQRLQPEAPPARVLWQMPANGSADGIALIPATAPDFFTEDTPTAVLVRQVLDAIAEFEKTSLSPS